MGSKQNLAANSMDAYSHQTAYDQAVHQRKVIMSWVFVVLTAVTLIMTFIMPVYEYAHRNKKTQYKIEGEFTIPKMISEFFKGGLGEEVGFLNTLAMLSAVLLIVCMIYLVVATFMAAAFRGKLTGIAELLTSYGVIEIVATLQFVFIMINMITARVDVSGEAKNMPQFWVIMATSYIFIALSISLSSMKKK